MPVIKINVCPRNQRLWCWNQDGSRWEEGAGEAHLVDVHVAVRGLAVAVQPEGEQEGHGEHGDGEEGVHQDVEQRGRGGRGPDLHCGAEHRNTV